MKIDEIRELLKIIDSTDLDYVKLQTDDLKLEASKKCKSTDTTSPATIKDATKDDISEIAVEKLTTKDNDEENFDKLHTVAAPLMGTFYASPNPDADNFVKVGDIVNKGETLCILEAMKLMNEITSEIKGEIIEVLTKNEELVEYNQPLFKIKPIK